MKGGKKFSSFLRKGEKLQNGPVLDPRKSLFRSKFINDVVIGSKLLKLFLNCREMDVVGWEHSHTNWKKVQQHFNQEE